MTSYSLFFYIAYITTKSFKTAKMRACQYFSLYHANLVSNEIKSKEMLILLRNVF